MKTTIGIDDDVLQQAKRLAQCEKTTLKVLTEEGLRLVLERRQRQEMAEIILVVFHGNGIRPGLPKDFVDNIRDWEDQDDPTP
jgi:hypothetical protein